MVNPESSVIDQIDQKVVYEKSPQDQHPSAFTTNMQNEETVTAKSDSVDSMSTHKVASCQALTKNSNEMTHSCQNLTGDLFQGVLSECEG